MESYELDERPWFAGGLWPEEIPKHLEFPENFPIYKFLEESATVYPDHVATIFFDSKIKYKELWDKVQRFASSLQNLGVKKGDRIGIYLPNCPQFVIAFFAINRLGCCIVPFNTQYVDHELEYQTNDSGARIIITIDITYNRVRKLRQRKAIDIDHIVVASLHDEMSASKRILGMMTGKVPPRRRIQAGDRSFNPRHGRRHFP